MKALKTSLALLWFALLFISAQAMHGQAKPAADVIITNATIWTVDKAHPQAEAVAVIGERIIAVGTSAEVDAWHGPQTKGFDAHGELR